MLDERTAPVLCGLLWLNKAGAYRPLVNEEKMSATGIPNNNSPRAGDRQFMESELADRNAGAHAPVTLFASLSLDDNAKPTGMGLKS